ncbi:Hypothetical predicted protein [Lecanosticta acicola]|uniref:Uncharacterized protein n=1 Tax=Lecanosticta acicola TaxID=111012 RepID=A0AAI8Z705_9PEZI|nr:Hypothetical predicted protein [Lecanosticta acicola]
MERDIAENAKERHIMSTEAAELRNQISTLQEELQDALQKHEHTIDDQQKRHDEAVRSIRVELEQRCTNKQKELTDLQDSVQNLSNKQIELENLLKGAQKRVAELEKEHKSDLSALQASANTNTRNLQRLQQTSTEMFHTKRQNSHLEGRLSELQGQYDTQEQALRKSNDRNQHLENENVANSEEIQTMQAQKSEAEMQVKILSKDLDTRTRSEQALYNNNTQLQHQQRRAEQKTHSLIVVLQSYTKQNNSLDAQLHQETKRLIGARILLRQTQDQLRIEQRHHQKAIEHQERRDVVGRATRSLLLTQAEQQHQAAIKTINELEQSIEGLRAAKENLEKEHEARRLLLMPRELPSGKLPTIWSRSKPHIGKPQRHSQRQTAEHLASERAAHEQTAYVLSVEQEQYNASRRSVMDLETHLQDEATSHTETRTALRQEQDDHASYLRTSAHDHTIVMADLQDARQEYSTECAEHATSVDALWREKAAHGRTYRELKKAHSQHDDLGSIFVYEQAAHRFTSKQGEQRLEMTMPTRASDYVSRLRNLKHKQLSEQQARNETLEQNVLDAQADHSATSIALDQQTAACAKT